MILLASKGPLQWLVSLICTDLTHASGGCHRSRQLLDILEGGGWHLQPLNVTAQASSRVTTLIAALSAAWKHGALHPMGAPSISIQGGCTLAVRELMRRHPYIQGVILEGTGYGALAAIGPWKAHGVRTVLVPANIESLAPNSGSWTHRGFDVSRRFAHERRWWAMADAIFTISVEESWWLELHGIKAEPLPYYPPTAHLLRLERIRGQRRPDPKVGLLWLADFRNPANRAGVPLTLRWITENVRPTTPVHVVGRGIDWLCHHLPTTSSDQILIHGDLGDEILEQLQCNCQAQLIVHPPTSGMLTRVVDAALAGIPIVGNSMALKSYRHFFSGYQSVGSAPLTPAVLSAPELPRAEAEAFLAILSKLSASR